MVSSKYIVRAKDLTKIYDGKKVVNKINFNVVRGEIFGILGPNGAGKTTTLEMMETIRPIDGGAVIIDGFNVANQQQKIKSIIGVQPQSPAFQDKTKLREIIELFGAAYGRKVNSENLLNQVDLIEKANSYVEDLSGGQKQRLSIAASLVHSPSVFFLDEPTTGLDPQARRHLWNLIESIRRSGVTIIMTTHYMDEAEKLCDRVAIMDEGKIVALDTPDVMIKNLLAKGFKKKRIVEQANLEDVFIDLTGKHLRE
ncbi:ABC transporter ATP-binding protein [Candidatus Saccharibacteria bacterium]|jgi:ABC-2 type transport system ATP-binding protein|nr:ABC transporter ATP-binding protein [Candidatus Saccharibacteria bacterium]HPW48329.1 ABC transporter ATP-binding protein [Candidatus Saccharibacteria bacterium]